MEHDTYRRMADIQDKHWWYEGRRRILAHLIGALSLPPNATILEAGCGPGANLKMLSHFGTVSAFDPDDFAKDYAAKISGMKIDSGFLPQPVPFSAPFDLVGAFDVIEHIEDDNGSVKALFNLTKQGGYGVFTVPAYQWMWSKHDEANHHKRRYTKASFKDVLEKSGYKIERISYYNTFLFPAIAAMRLIKKYLKIEDSPDETLPKLVEVNDILCAIFTAERHILKHFALPFGVSIVAVCKKP